MFWISCSLNRKFIAGTAAGLLLFSVIFLILFIGMYRSQLQLEKLNAADQSNQLLQTSLEAAMLRRDLDMLRTIINQFGKQKGVNSVSIVNRSGTIRFSDNPGHIDSAIDLSCLECEFDPARSTTPFSFFTDNKSGQIVLRTIHPVINRPACKECHGGVETNPVNGTLIIDYDASTIQGHAAGTTLALMGAGSIVVFLNLIGGWWFIHRFILRPLEHLEESTLALAEGNLDARVTIAGNDELARVGIHFNDMAESLQISLREVKRKELFLQALVDAIPDGIRVIDDQHNVLLANKTYCEQLSLTREQALDQTCYKSSHNSQTPCAPTLVGCPLETIAVTGEPMKALQKHTSPTGKEMAVEIYAAPIKFPDDPIYKNSCPMIVESIRDLDKTLQVSHEQKMSQIGRLAAGVAHEIHNPLASVRLALDSVLRTNRKKPGETPTEVWSCMELVDGEINRCIEVTKRLLKLSMFSGVEAQIVPINQSVSETLTLLTWEAAEDGVETVQDLDPTEPRLVANESDIRIAILNLVQNAFHAMPNGGRLTVTTRKERGQVVLIVEDNGVGITKEDLPHIFDPFFSRRADNREGTGLGLSITQALIERHGGKISVSSIPGQGSRFTTSFPNPDQKSEAAT